MSSWHAQEQLHLFTAFLFVYFFFFHLWGIVAKYVVVYFITFLQGGREVTVHPENTHLRLNIILQCTAQHAVQCKMVGWQQCAR